jgi:hypothetical protein
MTELAQYQPRQVERIADTDSWTGVLRDVIELAKGIANTNFVPAAYRGDVASVTAIILKGREMGVPPMAALAHISDIKGRPAQSAELMRAQVLRAGHSIIVDESSSTRAKVRGRRRGETEWQTASFTADEAKQRKIPLTGSDKSGNPSGYGPEEKLVARATSRLCRRMFADVVAFGLPPVDELEDIDAPPPPVTVAGTVQRKPRVDAPVALVTDEPRAELPATADDGPPLDEDEDSKAPRPVVDGSAGSLPVPPVTETGEAITGPQKRMLMALLNGQGLKEHDARMAWLSGVVGREVSSTNDLTVTEASTAIDALKEGKT